MMPGMSGYDVCRRIRADPGDRAAAGGATARRSTRSRSGSTASPPAPTISSASRSTSRSSSRASHSLLRIKRLHEQTQRQAAQLADWSATLERRVAEQVAENERLSRLKRFFSPKLAELIVDGSGEDPLKSRRREIVVVYSDLRGFTAFAETSEPEELMRTLGSFHGAMGRLVLAHEATLERFTGDGMMVFLGDPVPVENAAEQGVALALAMRDAPRSSCRRRGRSAASTSGSASASRRASRPSAPSASKGRIDYGAIGTVTNLAARLCQHAKAGEIIMSQRVYAEVSETFATEDLGELQLHGFARPMHAFRCVGPIGRRRRN